jgi:hypothetical protein
MHYNTAPSNTLFFTLRFVRTPYGNKKRALRMRCSWAEAVHTDALGEEEHTLWATSKDIAAAVLRLQRQHNAARTNVNVGGAEAKLLIRNDESVMA